MLYYIEQSVPLRIHTSNLTTKINTNSRARKEVVVVVIYLSNVEATVLHEEVESMGQHPAALVRPHVVLKVLGVGDAEEVPFRFIEIP